MKKIAVWMLIITGLFTVSCRKNNTYDRFDPNQDYERFINSHVFAACEFVDKPYARYSLANIVARPGDNSAYEDYYKVKFINGPCKGVAVWTPFIILKTRPVEDPSLLQTGTWVIRNYENPKTHDLYQTDHWNLGVVVGTSRAKKGIVDIAFPRDKNDFFPARESVRIQNVRTVVKPALKDVRTFIN